LRSIMRKFPTIQHKITLLHTIDKIKVLGKHFGGKISLKTKTYAILTSQFKSTHWRIKQTNLFNINSYLIENIE
jgi:hypothetical protein